MEETILGSYFGLILDRRDNLTRNRKGISASWNATIDHSMPASLANLLFCKAIVKCCGNVNT